MITASEPSWIAPFTGLSPRAFGRLITMLRREGADAVRPGRPWSLPLEDRALQLWTPEIKSLDDRYRAATVDDDGQALDQFHRLPGPDLWWWRHPRILVGDLGRSLCAAGAIGTDPDAV